MKYRSPRDQKRAEQRILDVQTLLRLGWKETITGIWKDAKGKYAYPTSSAIDLELLRGNILRSGRSKGFGKAKRGPKLR